MRKIYINSLIPEGRVILISPSLISDEDHYSSSSHILSAQNYPCDP